MKSYLQLVFCVPKMRNVSEIVYVENLDSSELVQEHMSNKSEIDDYNLNSDTETEKNSEVNESQILYNAAMILREKVQEIPKLNHESIEIQDWYPWNRLVIDETHNLN